jgi:predicted SnoaL-like aldol condensation-catalyzing enzyme
MRLVSVNIFTVLLIFSASIFSAFASSINPPTPPQTVPMSAGARQNLDFVLTWWREVIEARHTELAEKFQAEDYIQHNPNIPTGRAAFVRFFSSLGPPVNPLPEKLAHPPVVKGAKGDFVWLIFEHQDKDPRDPAKVYYYNSFDILRLQDGKIQEHWDSSKKFPGAPVFVPSSAPPPSKWNAGAVSKEEEQSVALATEELKDILQYGHLELADHSMDAGYIQHNPNVPQGRDGFTQFMSRIAGRTPQEIKPEWKRAPVLTLANGPYVLMMWDRTDNDPSDPTKQYTWNHFDVLRMENGRVKEHWDEAQIMPPPAGN